MNYMDFRSDTLTIFPIKILHEIDFRKLGDDCYGEDQLVQELEAYCAAYFEKKAALFMPTGTMSNQVGLRCLLAPGDELITEVGYHINFFESSQISALNGITINNVKTKDGILTTQDLIYAVHNKARWNSMYAVPKAVSIENSIAAYGGKIYPLGTLVTLHQYCQKNNIKIFLDGARLLNACFASDIAAKQYAKYVDMFSFCFAKGLGAPFGSILLGDETTIAQARRYRKWYGGGLHQSGLMAAIALNLFKNNLSQFSEDNQNATLLYQQLKEAIPIAYSIETNMVFIYVDDAYRFISELKKQGVLAIAWQHDIVRFVLSSLITWSDVLKASQKIIDVYQKFHTKVSVQVCVSFNNQEAIR